MLLLITLCNRILKCLKEKICQALSSKNSKREKVAFIGKGNQNDFIFFIPEENLKMLLMMSVQYLPVSLAE